MKHTIEEMKAKIHEMYPKIDKHGVAATVTFDKEKKTYVLELKKGTHHLATYIDKADSGQMHGRGRMRPSGSADRAISGKLQKSVIMIYN